MSNTRSDGNDGGFAGQEEGLAGSTERADSDPRGHMHREKRLTSDHDTREFLRNHKVAHVGTVDAAGWPYVVPLIYIYEGDDLLYLHTGDHRGHFLRNIQHNSRICVEVGEMGPVIEAGPSRVILRWSSRA